MKTYIYHNWLAWLVVIPGVLILGGIDWQTGYELNFFVFYFVPVSFAAWRLGLGESVVVSVFCALVWFVADNFSGHTYSSNIFAVWNTIIRLCSFLLMGWLLHRINQLLVSEKENASALQQSLMQIKVLEGFLTICCQCKKIKNEAGQWQQMESYISAHSDTTFSHGYCPGCAQRFLEAAGLAKKVK